jgi:hypothetical protein
MDEYIVYDLRSQKEQKSLAKRKRGKKLTTQQTQSSLNRVSRPPQGRQAREPQIELKDGAHLPTLYSSPLIHQIPAATTQLRVAIPEPLKTILSLQRCEALGQQPESQESFEAIE